MPAPLILAAVLAVVPRADTLRVVPHASPIVLRATYDSLETWSLANGVRSAGRPFAQRLTRSGEVWRLEVRYYDAAGRLSTTRVYESDARTLAPTHIAVHAATDSAEIVVNDGRVSGYVAPARKP